MTLTSAPTFPIFDPHTRANPQAVYHAMRAAAPIYRSVGPVSGNVIWFFTEYEDVQAVLKDPRFVKDGYKRLPEPFRTRYYGDAQDPVFAAINRHMLELDPPDHTRVRSLVHKAFTPRTIQALQPRIVEITHNLLDAMANTPECDLISEFAYVLPITVIAEMLGVGAENREKFREWTRLVVIQSPSYEASQMAALEFIQFINEQIDERQRSPKDDILSELVYAEEAGDKLDRVELISMVFLLLVAGHETTVNLIANGTLALMQHPAQMRKLQANPQLIHSAVEEMLRYNGPVETPTLRFVVEPTDYKGHRLETGDILLPSLLAANRDPKVFPNPDTFDITRSPNPHVAFGFGIHYCLGAPLARMEAAIAINALVQRYPNIRLSVPEEALVWNDSLLIHGMQSLPVRLD